MSRHLHGTIVEESLKDNRFLNELTITNFRISNNENPSSRWHLYGVTISEDQIQRLAQELKSGWYAHFWQGRQVIAVFENKIFHFDYDQPDTWTEAVEYGLSLGIPREQLDFPID